MSAKQGDMSHLDHFYLGGPVTPMSRAEEDEYAAWRADYRRRTTPVAEQGDVEATTGIGESDASQDVELQDPDSVRGASDHPLRDPRGAGSGPAAGLAFNVKRARRVASGGKGCCLIVHDACDEIDRLAAALADQTWEDMRAYNAQLEERAREAEAALERVERDFAIKDRAWSEPND